MPADPRFMYRRLTAVAWTGASRTRNLPAIGLPRRARAQRSSLRGRPPLSPSCTRRRAARAQLYVELVAAFAPVEHRGHEPGEVLRPPRAVARPAVALQKRLVAAPIPGRDAGRGESHISDREVQPLRASRRDDVRRVAGEEEPPVLHGLDHEATHRRDALPPGSRPCFGVQPSSSNRRASSSQMRSSGHS